MSSTNMQYGEADATQPALNWLLIVSFLPVILVAGAVLIIAGGFNLSFFIPAVVVGAMLGMLMYISIRDRSTS